MFFAKLNRKNNKDTKDTFLCGECFYSGCRVCLALHNKEFHESKNEECKSKTIKMPKLPLGFERLKEIRKESQKCICNRCSNDY